MLHTEFVALLDKSPDQAIAAIQAGEVDPNTVISGIPVIGLALQRERLDVAKELIAKGADVNLYATRGDHRGMAPVHFAKSPESIELLAAANAKIDAPYRLVDRAHGVRGETLLQTIILSEPHNKLALADALIKAGADTTKRFGKEFIAADAGSEQAIVRKGLSITDRLVAFRLEEERLKKEAAQLLTEPPNTITPVSMPDEEKAAPGAVQSSADAGNFLKKAVDLGASEPPVPQAPQVDLAAMPATLLGGKVARNEQGEYLHGKDNKLKVVDEGERLSVVTPKPTSQASREMMAASMELARHKGWSAIEVGGSEEFKREAWFHAKAAGLNVLGYTPDAKDLKRLDGEKSRTVTENSQPEIKLNEEFEQARDFALQRGGLRNVNKDRETCVGPIVYSNDAYLVQDIGRKNMVIHDRKDVKGVGVDVNGKDRKSVKISYDKGGARLTAKAGQEQGLGR